MLVARRHPGWASLVVAGLIAVAGLAVAMANIDGGGSLDRGGAPVADAEAAGGEQHDHSGGGSGPGPDSDAPPGATVDWLPNEDWVMQHWLPYTERDLWRVLRTNRFEIQNSLRVRPLAGLARRKHMSTRKVLRRLMAPVRREYPSRYRLLYSRAQRTFTQRHLMQHMFFHPLHHPKLTQYITEALGIGWFKISQLRNQGNTLDEIAQMQGLDPRVFERGGVNTIRKATELGVRRGAIPRRQAKSYVREVRTLLPKFWSGFFNRPHAHQD